MDNGKPIIDWLFHTFFLDFQKQKSRIAQYFSSNASVLTEDSQQYFGQEEIQEFFDSFSDSTEFRIETSECQKIYNSPNWFLILISGKKNQTPFNASFCIEIRSEDKRAFIQQITFLGDF